MKKNLHIILTVVALLVLAGCALQPIGKNETEEVNETLIESVNETLNISEELEEAEEILEDTEEIAETELEVPEDKEGLPIKEVIEGELVSFPNLKAVDPDGDPITYTFSEPLNADGEWLTKEGDAGEYIITITASDGKNIVTQEVLIIVNPKNRPPVIELESGQIDVEEGDIVILEPTVTDPEGEEVTVAYSGWMDSEIKETTFDDAGMHKVIITASDGKLSTYKEIFVNVLNVNRAPEIDDIEDVVLKEGEKVTIVPRASDPDGDVVKFIFDYPLDESGVWETVLGDAGVYNVTVIANDGDLVSETTFTLTIEALNRAPVIELDSPVEVNEGELVVLEPIITDPEDDEVTVSYTGWMTTNTKQTNYNDSGEYTVTITAKDSANNSAKLDVKIIVKDVNRPPAFDPGSFG